MENKFGTGRKYEAHPFGWGKSKTTDTGDLKKFVKELDQTTKEVKAPSTPRPERQERVKYGKLPAVKNPNGPQPMP